MMANLVYDIGCEPIPFEIEVVHPSERTTPEQGFVVGRKYAEAELWTVRMRYRDAPPEAWAAALHHWTATFGGSLLMDWSPPDGSAQRTVRFARMPELEQRGARTVSFSVELEDAP